MNLSVAKTVKSLQMKDIAHSLKDFSVDKTNFLLALFTIMASGKTFSFLEHSFSIKTDLNLMDDDIYVLKHLSYFHLFSFFFAHPVYHNNQCNKQTTVESWHWQLKIATLQGKDCLTWCYVFVPYFGDPRYIIGEWITMIWVRNSPRCIFLKSALARWNGRLNCVMGLTFQPS